MLAELVRKTRSIRRFDQSRRISRETLRELVDLARITASGSNKQPLKYMLFDDSADTDRIFPLTAWAGYLPDWPGPEEGERPAAYILILLDKEISETVDCDHGIAAQTIALAAMEKGIGTCMIGSIKRVPLRREFAIPDRYEIKLILALGYPVETVVLDEIKDGDVKYWRDENRVHHVPKRSLDEVIIN